MNIKDTFLALTSKTYPYGYEDELVSFLPDGYYTDEHGNYFYKIGDSKTAFTSHFDTACKEQVDVVRTYDNNTIQTDGKSILGADDKAGVTILLYMIEKKVPGLYCFFIGEEVGCIGSGLAAKTPAFKDFKRMISFDRRGTDSIITHQSSSRCCSDIFANALSKEYNKLGMNMKPDDTGVYTDSAEFTSIIPECTNISVGYYHEHTHKEYQDIKHLQNLCLASVKVDWENLPSERNPKVSEYKRYNFNQHSTYGNKFDYGNYSDFNRGSSRHSSGSHRKFEPTPKINKTYGYCDDFYEMEEQERADNWKKRNRGNNKIVSFDGDSYESDSSDKKNKKYYETLKQIIFDDNISAREFEIIKDTYLDMSDPLDRDFFNEMSTLI